MPPPKEGVDLRDRIYLHYAKMSVCLDLIPGDVKGKFYREGLIITSTLATKKKQGWGLVGLDYIYYILAFERKQK